MKLFHITSGWTGLLEPGSTLVLHSRPTICGGTGVFFSVGVPQWHYCGGERGRGSLWLNSDLIVCIEVEVGEDIRVQYNTDDELEVMFEHDIQLEVVEAFKERLSLSADGMTCYHPVYRMVCKPCR